MNCMHTEGNITYFVRAAAINIYWTSDFVPLWKLLITAPSPFCVHHQQENTIQTKAHVWHAIKEEQASPHTSLFSDASCSGPLL